MVEGEPIVPTLNPVPITLSYNKKNPRIIFNGLHSGGKSYQLFYVPLYHLTAMSGFALPARNVTVPIIKNIYHSFEIEKNTHSGSLESELVERAEVIAKLKPGDMVVIDEFLQHASPDAAADLEPIILKEFENKIEYIIIKQYKTTSTD
jgi:dsDNA-specific endonuclease/ATPase MutS2